MFQTVFKRYELKYMLTKEQKERVVARIAPYMRLDDYGKTTIRNLYFDTDTYYLIRRSIEKPIFKEKLRLRCYTPAEKTETVFVELKRKYKGIVYKRRLALELFAAMSWLENKSKAPLDTQISREIDYFLKHYGAFHPSMYLSYDRLAYFANEDSSFRVTFDENIAARDIELSLLEEGACIPLTDGDRVLMEIKCSGGIPLWMAEILSSEHIYKTSFSKYGTAYQKIIYPKLHSKKKTEDEYVFTEVI